MKKTCCALALSIALSGCSTMVAYTPNAHGPSQTVRYTQGVGTLSEKDDTQELFIYPTFKMQGTTRPTFTIGYANNTAQAVNFGPDNIRAYFRGAPVPIYTYNERIAEIEAEKRGQQVALAIIGGLAAGAAAYGASRQTYHSNYAGFTSGRRGMTSFGGSSTLRVHDPVSGILAGAAVGGVTVLGVQQLEYNAQNQIQSANSILQLNTVDALQIVMGDLVLKDCCDPYPRENDVIRFEVDAGGKMTAFEFVRGEVGKR